MKYKITTSLIENYKDIFTGVEDGYFTDIEISDEEYLILKLKYDLEFVNQCDYTFFVKDITVYSDETIHKKYFKIDTEVLNLLIEFRTL